MAAPVLTEKKSWHADHPGGCADCGTTERPHHRDGRCASCAEARRHAGGRTREPWTSLNDEPLTPLERAAAETIAVAPKSAPAAEETRTVTAAAPSTRFGVAGAASWLPCPPPGCERKVRRGPDGKPKPCKMHSIPPVENAPYPTPPTVPVPAPTAPSAASGNQERVMVSAATVAELRALLAGLEARRDDLRRQIAAVELVIALLGDGVAR